jgi:hypothetical protein
MRKKLKGILVIYLIIFFILNLIGCNKLEKEVFTGRTFEETIDVKLNNIFNFAKKNVSQSSNTDDYLKGLEHNEDYTYIISQGERSLEYMLERFSGNNTGGIEEYIMAAACSKILKQNPYTRSWNTGREWYDNYIKFLNNNPYATGNHDPITNPIYKSNKYIPLSTFLTKTEILKRIHGNHFRKEKWKIASIELKTYREYKFEDVPDKFDYGLMIDPDRMVWVVVTIYPDGYHGKRGFVDNAATISILDSETGDVLELYIYEDIKDYSDL